nr:hypothetical protein [Thiocapsa sp. KS1]
MKTAAAALALTLSIATGIAGAGPLDPDCTAEKAAKGAVTRATVGVGGRCSPAEAAKDSAKRTAGVEDKGPLDKHRDEGLVKKAVK